MSHTYKSTFFMTTELTYVDCLASKHQTEILGELCQGCSLFALVCGTRRPYNQDFIQLLLAYCNTDSLCKFVLTVSFYDYDTVFTNNDLIVFLLKIKTLVYYGSK